jgi:hypothetical protein
MMHFKPQGSNIQILTKLPTPFQFLRRVSSPRADFGANDASGEGVENCNSERSGTEVIRLDGCRAQTPTICVVISSLSPHMKAGGPSDAGRDAEEKGKRGCEGEKAVSHSVTIPRDRRPLLWG